MRVKVRTFLVVAPILLFSVGVVILVASLQPSARVSAPSPWWINLPSPPSPPASARQPPSPPPATKACSDPTIAVYCPPKDTDFWRDADELQDRIKVMKDAIAARTAEKQFLRDLVSVIYSNWKAHGPCEAPYSLVDCPGRRVSSNGRPSLDATLPDHGAPHPDPSSYAKKPAIGDPSRTRIAERHLWNVRPASLIIQA
jgi:hypothetical protein